MTITRKDIDLANDKVKEAIREAEALSFNVIETLIATLTATSNEWTREQGMAPDDANKLVQVIHANQLCVVLGMIGGYITHMQREAPDTFDSLRRQVQMSLRDNSGSMKMSTILSLVMPFAPSGSSS